MEFLEIINRFVWGVPALVLIVGVGVYLTIYTKFAQIRLFPKALVHFLRQFRKRGDSAGTSPYSALCTALAATVGTGNIVGVAGAITLGGPGAIFWLWVCAVLGMIVKFAEATLAVRYQQKNNNGELVGGPMYMIDFGMGRGWKFLAVAYSLFGVIASFGVGNTTQVNAVLMGIQTIFTTCGYESTTTLKLLIGVVLAVFTGIVLLGGVKRVSNMTERIVPFAAIFYLVLCVAVLLLRYRAVPEVLQTIFKGAFDPKAVTGGALGSAFAALRVGTSRGTFTNEAGMGTAAIAHAGAKVSHPAEQGCMGIMEVFLDTIVICTMTAFVILLSGIPIAYGADSGDFIAGNAFSLVLGKWSIYPLSIALISFAVATIIGWSLYGVRCAQYLFGEKSWRYFVWLQMLVMVASVFMSTGVVWLLAETMNGLMAIPNLIAILYLSPELGRLIKKSGVQVLHSGRVIR